MNSSEQLIVNNNIGWVNTMQSLICVERVCVDELAHICILCVYDCYEYGAKMLRL